MKLRRAIRPCVLGLTVIAAGCPPLESIEATFQDAPFTVKPVAAIATAPVYRVGDVYRFRIGDNLIVETVEQINDEGVWWRDSLGRRWVGSASALIPNRAVLKSNGRLEIISSAIEATGDLFPLTLGKTVAYRYTVQDGYRAARTHERSCTVGAFGAVKTAAGALDAYRIRCFYDGVARMNFYAPALGRVVLQTLDTIFDSVNRELVSFERGPAPALRIAKGGTMMSVAPASRPSPAPIVAKVRYGVQLAAYRSPARAKQAWLQIQRVGGALFEGQTPTIERHDVTDGTLYRLIVGAFATKNEARAYCRILKRGGIDCWPRARMAVKPPAVVQAAPSASYLRIVRR